MREFFQKRKKVIGIVTLLLILMAIPLFLYVIKQQQDTRQEAATFKPGGNTDTCGLIAVDVAESPVCPRVAEVSGGKIIPADPPKTNNVTSYTTTYTLRNTDTQKHTVKYQKHAYYCTSAYGVAGKDLVSGNEYPYCIDNPQIEDITVEIAPGATATIPVTVVSPSTSACGTYQTDFNITAIDGNASCTYKGPSPGQADGGSFGASGFCHTGMSCEAPTPTPTSTPVVTPTFTPTPSPTVIITPTGSPSATPTFTPTPTSSLSATPTPTGTLTPTPTIGITVTPTFTTTPTGTQTPTPSPTPTTVLAQSSPAPTLMATGPETIPALLGLGGIMIMILGSLIFFML